MKVVDLASEREKRSPHLAGQARCLTCKHEWTAVCPIGVFILKCPACDGDGHLKGACLTEYAQWVCQCDCDIFRVDVHGPYCLNCGVRKP